MLRYAHEIPFQLRNQTSGSRQRSRRYLGELLVFIRPGLLVNVYIAVASRVDALARWIVDNVVDPLRDRQSGDFLARLRVQNGDVAGAARDKQAVVRLVEGHGYVSLALCDRPTGNNGALLPVDDVHLILGLVINKDSWRGGLQSHSFESVPIDLDVGELFACGGVNNTKHRVRLVYVAAPIIDVEVFCLRVVADRVGIFQKFHTGEQSVGFSVENLDVTSFAIGNVNSIEILAIQHGVRLLDSSDRMNLFASF